MRKTLSIKVTLEMTVAGGENGLSQAAVKISNAISEARTSIEDKAQLYTLTVNKTTTETKCIDIEE